MYLTVTKPALHKGLHAVFLTEESTFLVSPSIGMIRFADFSRTMRMFAAKNEWGGWELIICL